MCSIAACFCALMRLWIDRFGKWHEVLHTPQDMRSCLSDQDACSALALEAHIRVTPYAFHQGAAEGPGEPAR